ncbi:hypothetical protein PAAG_01304 [Paracoccidioides lutzii Pb01]|uniref:Bud22 domain-containing protein n=1 Tax=Paracoccidioides lutzii (strain ATCC MYA-826 / Pb01) TaxID=502779 RepID=C1GS09_PARBA|nr:hypothetical protein PAAG_01304 [Paracoccidioides lutzii Pb01]EEH38383.2 hypothetical protein PAAG_01304 [Paracoccidioides lutzii Pb01]
MPKRKRTEFEEANLSNSEDRRLGAQIAVLEQKIVHGSQLIHRALKTARGFERQKLGRRQKTAKQRNETVQLSRISEEIQALKCLDLTVTAERQLLKHLVKTKRIAESPAFAKLSEKRPLPEGPKNGPKANVIARLFKSNPVRDVFPGIIDGIRGILGIVEGIPAEKMKDHENTTNLKSKLSDEVGAKLNSGEHEDFEGDLEMDDADLDQQNARLASSSESGSDDDDEGSDARPQRNTARYDPAADLSLSSASSVASADSTPAAKINGSKFTNKNPETTFLPSLTVGGYWSGSESADEDATAVAAAIQPRKNRMGQQARRKLWEKKFGSGANHLMKMSQEKDRSRDSGWDMRKGATSHDAMRGKRGRGGGFPRAMSFRRPKDKRVERVPDRNIGRPKAPQTSEQKPLHPSWEAAKKAKEQKSQAAFQGKKIVFD